MDRLKSIIYLGAHTEAAYKFIEINCNDSQTYSSIWEHILQLSLLHTLL